jgi:hypothetical protein
MTPSRRGWLKVVGIAIALALAAVSLLWLRNYSSVPNTELAGPLVSTEAPTVASTFEQTPAHTSDPRRVDATDESAEALRVVKVHVVAVGSDEPVAQVKLGIGIDTSPLSYGDQARSATSDPEFVATAVTSAAGDAVVALRRGHYRTMVIEGDWFIAPYSEFEVEESDQVITLSMAKGGAVNGRVVDARGRPVSGARVGAMRQTGDPGPVEIDWLSAANFALATTDASGVYSLRGLPEQDSLAVAAYVPGLASSSVTLKVTAGVSTTAPDIVLRASAAIELVILGEPEMFKAQAEFRLWPQRMTALNLPRHVDVTGQAKVTVSDVPGGTYTVRLLNNLAQPVELTTQLNEGAMEQHQVTLKVGERITGVVTDADDRPIAGALVFGRQGSVLRDAPAAQDGTFVLQGFTGKVAYITALATGYEQADEKPCGPGRNGVKIVLKRK